MIGNRVVRVHADVVNWRGFESDEERQREGAAEPKSQAEIHVYAMCCLF